MYSTRDQLFRLSSLTPRSKIVPVSHSQLTYIDWTSIPVIILHQRPKEPAWVLLFRLPTVNDPSDHTVLWATTPIFAVYYTELPDTGRYSPLYYVQSRGSHCLGGKKYSNPLWNHASAELPNVNWSCCAINSITIRSDGAHTTRDSQSSRAQFSPAPSLNLSDDGSALSLCSMTLILKGRTK